MPYMDILTGALDHKRSSDRIKKIGSEQAGSGSRKDRIEKACRDFESLFVQQMMAQMKKTVPQDGLFSGGSAEKLYSSMLDGELARTITQQRGIGLAPALIRQLTDFFIDEKMEP